MPIPGIAWPVSLLSALEELTEYLQGLVLMILQVVKAGFNADYGLFTSTEHGGLAFPAPASTQLGASAPALLRFLGAIFGKALYEGILLDTPLAPFFVAKLCRADTLCSMTFRPSTPSYTGALSS